MEKSRSWAEADNRSLQNEIAAREESIEDLQASLQRQRAQYGRELATVQTDYIQKLERERERTAYLQNGRIVRAGWFLLFADAMRMRYCRSAGFTPEQTDRLSPSSRWNTAETSTPKSTRKPPVTDVTAQMGIEQGEKGKRFVLRINGKNILDWFRSSSRGCSDGYGQRYSNRNGKQGIQTVMTINTYVPT